MRSKIVQGILDKTPKDVEVFVQKFCDNVVRLHGLKEEKIYSQKELEDNISKNPLKLLKDKN